MIGRDASGMARGFGGLAKMKQEFLLTDWKVCLGAVADRSHICNSTPANLARGLVHILAYKWCDV